VRIAFRRVYLQPSGQHREEMLSALPNTHLAPARCYDRTVPSCCDWLGWEARLTILLSAEVQRKALETSPYPMPLVSEEDLQPKDAEKTKEQVPPHVPHLLVHCIKST